MPSETRSRQVLPARAFTLVELLLTVALVLLFAGAVILNFGPLDDNARLEEGASQLETLFRYARGQAANTGRQVRILFGAPAPVLGGVSSFTNLQPASTGTNTGVQLLWEPDPVSAPGRLELLPGAELLLAQLNDLVQVREAGQPGTVGRVPTDLATTPRPALVSAASTNALPAEAVPPSMPPLICYPDGSSDSLEVVLAAASGDDKRLALVTLSGLTGASRHRLINHPDTASPPEEVVQTDEPWPD